MITADTLEVLTSYSPQYLTKAASNWGWRGPNFTSCKFLGITNGGQFCYLAVFPVEGGTDSTKIFLTYDHAEDRVSADYQLTDWA
jgi:hypothetical protein